MLFVFSVCFTFLIYIVISHAHFFSGKLILAAAGPTADSFFLGQDEIASGKLILATVGLTDLLLEKSISTPV